MADKLTAKAKKDFMAKAKAKGWKKVRGREAISAMMAEKLDHHPEWANVYKTVDVVLTTHDVGGVSNLDVAMAQFMDKTAGAAGR
jgi:4a-hydroxytetrahydrobiopterin dehydratase